MKNFPLLVCMWESYGYPQFQRYLLSWVNRVDVMYGLALVRDRRIDFLSLTARNPGHGDCGRFLAACMAAYDVVGVWWIFNADLETMLERRGFWHAADVFQGEGVVGMIWRKAAA